MPNRHSNANRVKLRRLYNVRELAKLFGVHKNTIGNWQRKGLKPIDGSKPILFLGAIVRDFQKQRTAARKCPCPPGTFYCFRCRAPRRPANAVVEYYPITATSGNLRAICATCETLVCRRVSRVAVAIAIPGIDVQFPDAKVRLIESLSPSLNCDPKRKAVA